MPEVTLISDGPDSSDLGTRETRWIHKWDQEVLNDTVAQDRPGDERFGNPSYVARSKNLAKQPSSGHVLRLVVTPSFALNTAIQKVLVKVIVEGMVALP